MDYCVCLLARLHGILPGMIKHADISRYGKVFISVPEDCGNEMMSKL